MSTCTNILLAQMQVCPAFLKADDTTPAAAWSMSASSNTMKGALPPSSRETCGYTHSSVSGQLVAGRLTHSLFWPSIKVLLMLELAKGSIMLELASQSQPS